MAISGVSIAFIGYCFGNLPWFLRLGILFGSVMIIIPHFMTNIIGLLILLSLIFLNKRFNEQ